MPELAEQRNRLEQVRKDFEVTFRFFSPEEGGRNSGPPAQPYRSDWSYEGDDPLLDGIYMIWPIFLDEAGQVREPGQFVPTNGIARMHIVNEELRFSLHAKRLKPGIKGYFMEGPHRVAEAVVTKLLAISETE